MEISTAARSSRVQVIVHDSSNSVTLVRLQEITSGAIYEKSSLHRVELSCVSGHF